jgi:hypothetical protein
MATPVVLPIIPLNTTGQELTPVDSTNVASISLQNSFDVTTDIIQAYLYDTFGTVITQLTTNYSTTSGLVSGSNITQLNLDPAQDLANNGYLQGAYQINYNFLRPSVTGNPLFFISAISSDRTELRIKNSSFSEAQTQQVVQTLQTILNTGELFKGVYLDFGSDTLLLAVNIAYDNNTVLVKLYEALPFNLGINSNFNFVEKASEPVAYSVQYPVEEIPFDDRVFLQGPNLSINIQQVVNNSTDFQSFSTLLNAPSASLTDQLKSILVERRAELNTDYSDFENFTFFSSAEQRLINFYYKASQIEAYNTQIATLDSLTNTVEVSSSKATYQNEINKIITNFDGYDYYLYFESSSTAWPKSNSTKPYTLFSTGSSEVLTWYADQLDSASLYDEFNQNYIYNIYPDYITSDPDNDQFKLFNEEIGQMFDQIWLYTKAIENRQDSDNSLGGGISVDLVADALRSYGVTLYESSFTNSDLYTTYLGITPEGSTLPPTGSELITNYVTASADTTPFNDAQKLIYKRLYHNLPFLLKKKGTLAGLRVLLNCFGIPDTILRINEFGGKDENPNTWDNWQSEFSYAFSTSGSNYITSSFSLNTAWGAVNNKPGAVEFRFKTPGLPTSGYYSQSLWSTDTGVGLLLKYTGSGTTSGSYSGSIIDPEYQYGILEFYPSSSDLNTTASIYLPFFDGNWWSVLINNEPGVGFTAYAKNKIYNGVDGNTIGFQGSASISASSGWSTAVESYFGSSSFSAKIFSGSLQEIRYYKNALSESVFDDYVMNPNSIEGNQTNTSPSELVFRAALGGELYTASLSIHPKVSGTWATTSSFVGTSGFYYKNTPTFVTNVETVFYDQVPAGIQNAVSDKIHLSNTTLPPSGSTNIPENTVLSPFRSIQQTLSTDEGYTRDVNYVEIALSPQNEINDDINSSIGYFNIGEYIGDPRNVNSEALIYPDLESLSNSYFQKYSDSYNWNDYTRLAKYFDNAVFRMVKDFIPARAGVSAGVVIKQHLLERNRQRPAQTSYTQPEYTGSVTSLARDYQTGSIEVFSGGPAGSVNNWVNISQSWSSSLNTKAGVVNQINSSEYEFYNGEYSGSTIDVVNGQLLNNPLLGPDFRLSIPDLQTLNVGLSGTQTSVLTTNAGGAYRSTGTLMFSDVDSIRPTYNTGTYTYTPLYDVSSNLTLNISGTFHPNAEDPTYFNIYYYLINSTDNTIINTYNYSYDPGATITTDIFFTNTFTLADIELIPGKDYKITFSASADAVGDTTSIDFLDNINTNWNITINNLAAQSTYYLDPTVYTQQNFPGNINQYSEYNSLLNNVYSNRVSNKYYDVDYNGDALNPTNFTALISESALYAQVQDSNYSPSSSWSTLRYAGVKNIGNYNTNIAFASESQTPGYPIDNFTNYFAVFSNNTSADPEYPGGSNFKLVSIVDTQGQVTPLTGDNNYVGFISSMFKSGITAIAYSKDVSNQNTFTNLEVIEGGGRYDTILVRSGSYTGTSAVLGTQYENGGFTYSPLYATGSLVDNTLLREYSVGTNGWNQALLTSSDASNGKVLSFSINSAGSYFKIYNKKTKQYTTAGNTIIYGDTYFPLQNNDFIRFGLVGGNVTASLDYSFTAGGLVRLLSSSYGANPNAVSTLITSPELPAIPRADILGDNENQNFRIFRRIPDETSVVVSTNPQINITSGEVGLLIPYNFNPNYDPITIAKAAGLIS